MVMDKKKLFLKILRFPTLVLKKTESLSSLAVRLVYLTKKFNYPVHPKHLLPENRQWYIDSLEATDVILDIGCNTGQHTLSAAKRCKRIIGLDLDLKLLAQATLEAKKRGIHNAKFIGHDANRKLPFMAESFHKVLLFAVLEHLIRRKGVLDEVYRVLKPSGHLFLSVPNKNTTWKRWQRKVGVSYYSDRDHKIEYTAKGIQKLLLAHGFQVLAVFPVALDMPFVGFIDVIGGIWVRLYRHLSRLRKKFAAKYPKESISFQIIVRKSEKL